MAFDRFRFIICIISFLCLAVISSNQIIINFTFICMTKDVNDTITMDDGSTRQRFAYSQGEKSLILSSIAIGTMLATFPITHLYAKYGARHLFVLFGLLSCAVTAAMPFAARNNFALFLFFRFVQGAAYASDFTTIGKICVEWAPLREISFFIGFLTVFNIWSAVYTNPVTAWFCENESFGWEWSYYAHAAAGCVLFGIWWLVYRDDPRDHCAVSDKELRVIHKNKSAEHVDNTDRDVPYRAIITHPTIIVCWISAFLDITCTILLITYAPTYFSKVLHYDIETTGYLVAFVSFSQLPFKTLFCLTSDRLRWTTERNKMLFYNGVAFVACGVAYAAIAIAPWRELVVILFSLVSITSSANCGSFYKCATYVARQHAHFVISAIQFSKCVSLFAAPVIVATFVSHDTDTAGWNVIFVGFGAILIVAHFVFWRVVTDEPAEFTKNKEKGGLEEEMNEGRIACSRRDSH